MISELVGVGNRKGFWDLIEQLAEDVLPMDGRNRIRPFLILTVKSYLDHRGYVERSSSDEKPWN